MADTPRNRTPKYNRGLEGFSPSFDRVTGGMRAKQNARGGGVLSSVLDWSGIPSMRRNAYNDFPSGGGVGFWGNNSGMYSGGGGGGGGGGGNDDPSVDPNDPAALGKLGKVGGFPQWYIDWFKSQGVYGGVPPVQGLL